MGANEVMSLARIPILAYVNTLILHLIDSMSMYVHVIPMPNVPLVVSVTSLISHLVVCHSINMNDVNLLSPFRCYLYLC